MERRGKGCIPPDTPLTRLNPPPSPITREIAPPPVGPYFSPSTLSLEKVKPRMPKEPTCQLCQQTKSWHEEHKPHHLFNSDSDQLLIQQSSREVLAPQPNPRPGGPGPIYPPPSSPPQLSFPSDPVLRMALIEAGVLTTQDLDTAEKKLQALIPNGGMAMAQPSYPIQTYQEGSPPPPNSVTADATQNIPTLNPIKGARQRKAARKPGRVNG